MAFSLAPFYAFVHALYLSLQSFLIYIKLARRPSETDVESALSDVPPVSEPSPDETARTSPTPHLDVQTLLSRATIVVSDADNSYLTQASVYSQDGTFHSTNTEDGGSPDVSSDSLSARPKDQMLSAEPGCLRRITLSVRNPDVGAEDDETLTDNSTLENARPKAAAPASKDGNTKTVERRQGMVLPPGGGFSDIAGRRGKSPLRIRVVPTMAASPWEKLPQGSNSDQTSETPAPSDCSTPLPKYSTTENTPVADTTSKNNAWLPADRRTVQHNRQGYVLSYLAQQNGMASLRLPLLEGQTPSGLINPPPYGSTASLLGSPELSLAQASGTEASRDVAKKPSAGIRPLRLPAQVAKRNITPQTASPILRPLLLPQDMANRTGHASKGSILAIADTNSLKPKYRASLDAPVSPRMERILDLLDAAGVASSESTLDVQPFDFARIGRQESSSSIASTNGSLNTESTSYQEDFETEPGVEDWKHDIISAYTVSPPKIVVE